VPDYAREYEMLLDAYSSSGGDRTVFSASDVAHMVVHKNKVVGLSGVDGLVVEPTETESGIKATITVKAGHRIPKTVHMCFGMLPEKGLQTIDLDITVEDNASVSILAHCIFPNAVEVKHVMDAVIRIGQNASYRYYETHVHGDSGGVEVIPNAKVYVGKGGYLYTEFALLEGRVGKLDVNYESEVEEDGVIEMLARVNGTGNDDIKIRESSQLKGRGSRGVLKTRIALRDEAKGEVYNELVASGAEARGHVDCKEIVQDRSLARAVPIATVLDPTAQVTHEAAIGTVDKKQLLTLMARGLGEEEAEEVIIKGMLGEE
jgi:Fe-S cluster assembly scaffold protein SufB